MKEFWIFGYGSLMWRPGFDYEACEPALIRGLHRKLCIYSHIHRGTPEQPGLVLGLDRGGSCHGMAFRVDTEKSEEVLSYLRGREQVTMVYTETTKRIALLRSARTVEALVYAVDRRHPQYAGHLDDAAALAYVRQGRGVSGHCVDYVLATAAHLRDMNIRDVRLERLAQALLLQTNA